MKAIIKQTKNEQGSVLVVALLILVLLTIIGISASTTSDIETQIAGNDKFHKMAFYNADSGIYATPKLISANLDEGSEQTITGITYIGSGVGTFYREIMGYDAYDSSDDARFTIGTAIVDVDVNRTGTQNIAGGGVEFGSGSEGVGVGSAGGVAIFYAMGSLNEVGQAPLTTRSELTADYRKVVGISGGL